MAVKAAELWPTFTVTLAGAVSFASLDCSATTRAVSAGADNVTMQVAVWPAPTVPGVQLTPLNCAGALRFSVKFCVTPFRLAVSAAV